MAETVQYITTFDGKTKFLKNKANQILTFKIIKQASSISHYSHALILAQSSYIIHIIHATSHTSQKSLARNVQGCVIKILDLSAQIFLYGFYICLPYLFGPWKAWIKNYFDLLLYFWAFLHSTLLCFSIFYICLSKIFLSFRQVKA